MSMSYVLLWSSTVLGEVASVPIVEVDVGPWMLQGTHPTTLQGWREGWQCSFPTMPQCFPVVAMMQRVSSDV
jgi:hypothetical protein